ncbi:UvrD-helicase domain-containing protein [Patescibacteria group bacterium]|nr:UvrD-helicase domain-containing protein [Patescibacteria group bacterium]
MPDKILQALNEQQQAAAQIKEGPVLVLAGAGSGKTRVLTHRIAYLISQGANPGLILGVTFTNKAAGEMKERVQQLMPSSRAMSRAMFGSTPTLGTFHSICARLLRQEIEAMGYKSDFVIYDSDDSLKAIKVVMDRLSIPASQVNPRLVKTLISSAKNELMTPIEYEKHAETDIQHLAVKIYQAYQQLLQENQAQDFDDLIMTTVKLFEQNKAILDKYQRCFQHVLVDEYQDTNQAQYTLLNLLSQKHKNIFVVGDDWQSIYGWRGANVRNILDFEKDYPGTQVIKLERNYRSTQNILDVAHEVITKNYQQKDKKLWTKKPAGDKAVVYEAQDERDEGSFVVGEIEEAVNGPDRTYNDFVILYRTNAQSRALEEVFIRRNIPYKIIGGVRFYERREVKDILAHLKVLHNPHDSISLQRIINVPARGAGKVTLQHLDVLTQQNGGDGLGAVKMLADERGNKKLADFYRVMKNAQERASKLSLAELIDCIVEKTGYKDFILDGTIEGEARWDNIQELKSVANNFADVVNEERLSSFLEEISLLADTDEIDEQAEAVTMMTVHSAKGLEYPAVFMVGMEENIFPHSRSLLEPAELEEERRLCYVGMTRAQEKLYLTYAQSRSIFGNIQSNPSSRFLEDIPAYLLDYVNSKTAEPSVYSSSPSITTDADEAQYVSEDDDIELVVGDKVVHPQFGLGTVKEIEDNVLKIAFTRSGIKALIKEYAQLQKIEDK